MKKISIRILIFTILALFTLQGCFKDFSFNIPPLKRLNNCNSTCFIFQGTVYDPNNSEPISATIEIIYSPHAFISFATNYGEIETNEKGYYSVNLNAKNYKFDNGDFILIAKREGYLTNKYDGQVVIRDMDSTNYDIPVTVDIILLPEATLQFNFDISKPQQLQSLSYAFKYAKTKYHYTLFEEKWVLDTLFSHPVAGDQYVHTEIKYKENNQQYTIQDSIYLKKGETKLITTTIN